MAGFCVSCISGGYIKSQETLHQRGFRFRFISLNSTIHLHNEVLLSSRVTSTEDVLMVAEALLLGMNVPADNKKSLILSLIVIFELYIYIPHIIVREVLLSTEF